MLGLGNDENVLVKNDHLRQFGPRIPLVFLRKMKSLPKLTSLSQYFLKHDFIGGVAVKTMQISKFKPSGKRYLFG